MSAQTDAVAAAAPPVADAAAALGAAVSTFQAALTAVAQAAYQTGGVPGAKDVSTFIAADAVNSQLAALLAGVGLRAAVERRAPTLALTPSGFAGIWSALAASGQLLGRRGVP
jgi:hypothetical protein